MREMILPKDNLPVAQFRTGTSGGLTGGKCILWDIEHGLEREDVGQSWKLRIEAGERPTYQMPSRFWQDVLGWRGEPSHPWNDLSPIGEGRS
jgi:hypothetical protein